MTVKSKTPIVVVYHGGCNDGIAAAWAAWTVLGDEAEYVYWHYGAPLPQVHGKIVIMVDISPTPEQVEELKKISHAVMIVDHHDSSIRRLPELPVLDKFSDFMKEIELDTWLDTPVFMMATTARSGAVLSWLFFKDIGMAEEIDESKIPKALLLIEDYDLFIKKYQETVPFNEWLASSGRYIDNFDDHVNEHGTPVEITVYTGKMIMKKTESMVRDIMRNYVRYINWRGFRIGLVNAPSAIRNEVAEQIMKKDGVDFALIYQIRNDKVVFSARGKDKQHNLGLIAEEFGGGGHEDAAAFAIDLNDIALLEALGIAETITF